MGHCKLETPQTIGLATKISSRLKLLISSTILNQRQEACEAKSEFSCGVGILPAHRRVIENGARCELKPTAIVKQS